jgi:hypothetical protein
MLGYRRGGPDLCAHNADRYCPFAISDGYPCADECSLADGSTHECIAHRPGAKAANRYGDAFDHTTAYADSRAVLDQHADGLSYHHRYGDGNLHTHIHAHANTNGNANMDAVSIPNGHSVAHVNHYTDADQNLHADDYAHANSDTRSRREYHVA